MFHCSNTPITLMDEQSWSWIIFAAALLVIAVIGWAIPVLRRKAG